MDPALANIKQYYGAYYVECWPSPTLTLTPAWLISSSTTVHTMLSVGGDVDDGRQRAVSNPNPNPLRS